MSRRIALQDIRALTLYKDADTVAHRGRSIPQLTCVGKPCRLYQPEVVRCTSLGGSGTNVDWQCEADLPDSLRFGKVQVSCEGWDRPGDPYVLEGSCGLEYRLVQVPDALRRGGDDPIYRSSSRLLADDLGAYLFMFLWLLAAGAILFFFLRSCFSSRTVVSQHTYRPSPPGGGWFPGGWFPGGNAPPDSRDPPPPYSKYPSSSATSQEAPVGWRLGFLTGAALGGLGGYMMNRQGETRERPGRMYDWERERQEERERPQWAGRRAEGSSRSWFGGGGGARRPAFDDSDRGEGPSNLGNMRRSVGMGGSSVR